MSSSSGRPLDRRVKTFRIAIRKFGPFESAIRKQWEFFRRATGCPLELDAQAFDLHPLNEQIFDAPGLGGGAWDIAFVNTDWMATLYDSGAALDLAPLIARKPPEDYPQGWTPSLLRFQEFDGCVLGLPYHDGPECLIYRRDLFENPGEQAIFQERFARPLAVPETWDEFREAARFFHRPEERLYGTVFAAFPDGHNTVYDFCLQLWTRGGEIFRKGSMISLRAPEVVQALEFYREMLQGSSSCHPLAKEFDSVQSGLAFARGEIALMINWFGFAAMAETVGESNVRGRVGVAGIPHGPGFPSASLNVYWLLVIGKGSPHQETAYEFLRYCASARMDKLLTLEGGIGCRRSTWEDPEVNHNIPFYSQLKEIHGHARELPRIRNWTALASIIDDLTLKTINTSRPVTVLVDEAQKEVEKLFAGQR